MALCTIQFGGDSIGMKTAMNVIVPDQGSGPFPVLYLLHGLSDDHTTWLRRTSIERYLTGVPLIVVMPNGGRSFYTNGRSAGTFMYEDHIVKDVIGAVDRLFPTIKHRRGRAIGGLSMGGYGAVKLAMKYPNVFCSAHSHSGALNGPPRSSPEEWGHRGPPKPEFAAIFGPRFNGNSEDIMSLVKLCSPSRRPHLRVDCGVDDFLLPANRRLHRLLDGINYRHEYEEHPGEHGWDYWDLHVQSALKFHCRHLKTETH